MRQARGIMDQRQLAHREKGSSVSQIIMKRLVCLQPGRPGQASQARQASREEQGHIIQGEWWLHR